MTNAFDLDAKLDSTVIERSGISRKLELVAESKNTPAPESSKKTKGKASINGTYHRQDGEWSRILELGGRTIPQYPGPSVIKPVLIPHPPKLDPAASDLELVQHLASTYRSMLWHQFKIRSCFLTSKVESSPHFEKLLACAKYMLDAGISPGAWCAFTLETWKQRSKNPPTTAFTFSMNRLTSRQEWFEDFVSNRFSNRLFVVEGTRELYHDWLAMQRELLLSKPETNKDIARIVDKHFPRSTYEDRIYDISLRSKRAQREIDSIIREGSMVW